MNILVVHYQRSAVQRASVVDHLHCFERYSGCRVFYLNVGRRGLPTFPPELRFSLVVFHNTFFSLRWTDMDYFQKYWDLVRPLAKLGCPKLMMPQDEFLRADVLSDFAVDMGVETILTVVPESERVYKKAIAAGIAVEPALTGYLDAGTLERIERLGGGERDVDVFYRAYKAKAWLGSFGALKPKIAEVAVRACERLGLRPDISTRPEDTLLGDRWYEVLLRSKATIGVEGGSSIHDHDGSVKAATERYVAGNPEAGFEEIEKACFPGRDGEAELVALSPRHLEACATRTCQVLVEGHYNGILRSGVDFIPVKRDLSDMEDALKLAMDDEVRARIVESAYGRAVASGEYTYEKFVEVVLGYADPGSGGPDGLAAKWHRWNRRQEERSARKNRLYAKLRKLGSLLLPKGLYHRALALVRK